MSQDLRDYRLIRLDERPNEARELSVTATVGPSTDGDNKRGVQFTLDTPDGFAYARVSQEQIQDLIEVLSARIDPDTPPEATGIEATRKTVQPDGGSTEVPR
jgi:hypothetical protein